MLLCCLFIHEWRYSKLVVSARSMRISKIEVRKEHFLLICMEVYDRNVVFMKNLILIEIWDWYKQLLISIVRFLWTNSFFIGKLLLVNLLESGAYVSIQDRTLDFIHNAPLVSQVSTHTIGLLLLRPYGQIHFLFLTRVPFIFLL